MRKFYHKKLIRDKIPELIEANKDKYEVRVMDDDEFKRELKRKLIEEAKEVKGAKRSELLKELADVLELIKSIAESEDISFEVIEKKRRQRRKERGGFKKRLFLIWSGRPAGK